MKYLNLTILALFFSISVFALGPISGRDSVCAGSTTTLSNATSGGTWSSSLPAVASIDINTGVVTGGVIPTTSTTVITYSAGGSSVTTTVTVTPLPTMYTLTGGGGYCSGGSGVPIGLNGSQIGTNYQLYTGSIAVGAAVPGTGSAVSFGMFTIAAGPYVAVATNTVTGCTSIMSGSATVTINPLPYAYTCSGGGVFCAGAPGVWFYVSGSQSGVNYQLYNSSGPVGPPIPGVGSTINFDSVIAAGTYSVLATNVTTGCINWMSDSVVVYINPALSPITGTASACSGFTTQLSDATPGGVWSASNAAIATIGSTSGLITTNLTATAVQTTMTYSVTTGYGCVATTTITVNPLPSVFAVTGGGSYPTGGSGVLIGVGGSQTGVNYGLYIGSTLVATLVGTGAAISFGPQMVAGTYTVIATSTSTLCTNVMGSTTVTICTPPAAISGPNSVCQGSTINLSDATPGGTWSSSNTIIATINATSGIITGISSGITTVSYSPGTGCSSTTTITVNPIPAPITGPSSICDGTQATLNDVTAGGDWSTSNSTVATIGSISGIITGVSSGITTVSYFLGTGCSSITTLTVNPSPAPISATSFYVCPGSATTLGDVTPAGTWSSSNISIATINGLTAIVTGVSTGTTIISYILPTACIATQSVTVLASPSPITGPSSICDGSQATLNDATSGGAWSSSNTLVATINTTSGIITGISSGIITVSYSLTSGCSSTTNITVNPTPSSITGITTFCTGTTTYLSDVTAGGTWSSSNIIIATVNLTTGEVYSLAVGMDTIRYSLPTSCSAFTTISTSPLPTINISAIPGDTVCAGAPVQLIANTTGTSSNTYQWSLNGVVIPGGTGDTSSIYHPLPGDSLSCMVTGISTCSSAAVTISGDAHLVINTVTITATSSESCNGIYTLVAGGGTSYSWSPATGLSCSTCATTTVNPSASGTYIVTGVTGGCSDTASVLVVGNRISGSINYSGVPTDTFKVWLIHYNPADSIILALDSTFSCMSGGVPYYQFLNPAPGNYMAKAQLLSSIPGTSGYIPTYSLSSPDWSTAASLNHTITTDLLNINMLYGAVPPGPGFIGGNVYSGAGRGTSVTIPASGMLIYLKDIFGSVLTFTYTDSTGAYAFSNLAYGSYLIYPEDYKYYTTPSAIIVLNGANPSVTTVDFKQHTTSGTITPNGITNVKPLTGDGTLSIFPNPAKDNLIVQWNDLQTGSADLRIADMMGREVLESTLSINATTGQARLDIASLAGGVYFITIRSGNTYLNSKLLIQK